MDFVYDRYFDYKIFELIRDRLNVTVNQYRKDEEQEDYYRHIFLAPEAIAKRKSFQLQGAKYPFVALWANSQFQWSEGFYSRSTLRREFSYIDPETRQEAYCNGFLYDMHKEYVIHGASYFQTFIQKVSRDLTDFDRLRYFTLYCDELLPGFKTKIEFKQTNKQFNSTLNEDKSERNFTGSYLYDVSVTFPVIDKSKIIDKIEIYLNKNKIYESGVHLV